MQYTINQLYNSLYERVNTIYDTFKGFFGDENVDLQKVEPFETLKRPIENWLESWDIKPNEEGIYELLDTQLKRLVEVLGSDRQVTIYVWWNRVIITNENNKSVNIQDLYAQIDITLEGRIPYENWGFLLNRATYTKEQFLSDYMHSHICDIPKSDFTKFQRPCLGTGPIKETIGTLKNEYDEVTWMLFCEELALYVTVESITGRPYRYLEHIGGDRRILSNYSGYDFTKASIDTFERFFTMEDLKEFIKYYLQEGHLFIAYRNGKYVCGMPYYEYIIDVSNAFIDFYNDHLASTNEKLEHQFDGGLLTSVLVINGKFYKNGDINYISLDRYRNKPVLKFKGRDIVTTITEYQESEAKLVTIIDNSLAMYILKNILRTINFRYRNEHRYYTAGSNQDTSSAKERVSYL